MNDVTLRRLTKASFNINNLSIIDLLLAYFIGMISFLFIYYYCYNPQSYISCIGSPSSVAIFGLLLLFCGRIITKRQGVFFGKMHYSMIFVSSAILLILDTIIKCKLTLSDFGSNFGIATMEKIFNQSYNVSTNYLELLYSSRNSWQDSLFFISFAGSLVLAIIGEAYLASSGPSPKSLLAVAEKFPSDFTVITGVYNGHDNIQKLLKDNFEKDVIVKIKCVTKSLVFVELIGDHLISQSITYPNTQFDYRILKSPKDRALDDRMRALLDLPFSLTNSLKNRKTLYNEFEHEYNVREAYLNELIQRYNVRVNDYYFGETMFLIMENSLGVQKLLFLIKDRGNMNNRVGLYTESQYIIDMFSMLFENAWLLLE